MVYDTKSRAPAHLEVYDYGYSPNDNTFIQILKNARQEAQKDRSEEGEETFIKKLLCLLADPVKTNEYMELMSELRIHFHGIAEDEHRQDLFQRALKPRVIEITDLNEAVTLGRDRLFELG